MKYLFFLFIIFFTIHSNIYSQNEIQKIQNGALLVRLQTNQHLIDHYTNSKMLEKSNLEKQEQTESNKYIINTFKKEWLLSPVYFFYSNFSHEIKNNNFTHVFKDDGRPLNDEEKSQLHNNVLIVYIGDTPGSLKFNALVLTDHNFQTLKSPYPRYVRTYQGFWFFKRRLEKSVQILQQKINFQLSRIN